jgi:hypothetical protein
MVQSSSFKDLIHGITELHGWSIYTSEASALQDTVMDDWAKASAVFLRSDTGSGLFFCFMETTAWSFGIMTRNISVLLWAMSKAFGTYMLGRQDQHGAHHHQLGNLWPRFKGYGRGGKMRLLHCIVRRTKSI